MTPGVISKKVVTDRLDWVTRMLAEIRSLPLHHYQDFIADKRNVWSAESCLRRGLEALLDIGRHLLAKGFATGVTEYKEIAQRLGEFGVLSPEEAGILRILAGYRNRLIHFYREIGEEELFKICKEQLGDLEIVKDAYLNWLKGHPDKIDERL
ncbi:MAG: DUF86 domain-containing protein [Deltaproteobacteria bacterium]|nr:DUF86 domain-containing protein [Deltaproteobacteria bacterium]